MEIKNATMEEFDVSVCLLLLYCHLRIEEKSETTLSLAELLRVVSLPLFLLKPSLFVKGYVVPTVGCW